MGSRTDFAARLLAYGPLSPNYGPLDIDLMRRIRRYAPSAHPRPLSRGETVSAAGDVWRVLWPPAQVTLGTWGQTAITDAIEAYDRAALEHPELAERLRAVRDSETYRKFLEDSPDELDDLNELDENDFTLADQPLDPESVTHHDGLPRDSTGRDFGPGDREPAAKPPQKANSLEQAGEALRAAANSMSLVLVSNASRILLTGDATRSAMNAALKQEHRSIYSVVVTPHHGGKDHVPAAFDGVQANVWISSAGGTLTQHVSDSYDRRPGLHHRTDRHGDAQIVLWGDHLYRYQRTRP